MSTHKNQTDILLESGTNELEIVDLREEIKKGNYSGISDDLEITDQAIIFVNRKGLATSLICRDCGLIYEPFVELKKKKASLKKTTQKKSKKKTKKR